MPMIARKNILEMCLLDDVFMNVMLDEDTNTTGAILRIIMDTPDLIVKDVKAQSFSQNLEGRSVRFDVKAVDSNGTHYDIEVQKQNDGANPKRVRFNAAMMDKRLIDSGEDWESLPRLCIIFITEKDILGGNLPIYHINRKVNEFDCIFDDQEEVIFVNCEYDDGSIDTDIEKLIHDFKCYEPSKMYLPELKQKANYYKYVKEGKQNMSEYIRRVYAKDFEKLEKTVSKKQKSEDIVCAYNMMISYGFNEEEAIKAVSQSFDMSTASVKRIVKS